MTKRRVAITGLGVLTSCGQGWEPYWQAVLKARSHVGYLSNLSPNEFPVPLAGEISDFDPSVFIKVRKSLKVMSREIQMAVAASYLAVQDSGLALAETDRMRFGISLGTGIINNDLDEVGVGIRTAVGPDGKFRMEKFGQEGIRSMFPLWFLKYLPNMPACHISIAHGLSGPSNTVTTSSAAGAQAIGDGEIEIGHEPFGDSGWRRMREFVRCRKGLARNRRTAQDASRPRATRGRKTAAAGGLCAIGMRHQNSAGPCIKSLCTKSSCTKSCRAPPEPRFPG